MALLQLLAGYLSLVAVSAIPAPPPQHPFHAQPIPAHAAIEQSSELHYPTVRESVAMARKIMHLTTIGDLVTTFPDSARDPTTAEDADVSSSLNSSPIGLMEYYADCDPHSGNPILLAIDIATPYKNYAAGSNISLSIRWWPDRRTHYALSSFDEDDDDDDHEIPTPHTPAALPRFSLHGRLEPVTEEKLSSGKIAACFQRSHPDSKLWQPGNDIHTSHYVQLVVEHVYWFGGFGDRARIGWLPVELWRELELKEVMQVELPGEEVGKRPNEN